MGSVSGLRRNGIALLQEVVHRLMAGHLSLARGRISRSCSPGATEIVGNIAAGEGRTGDEAWLNLRLTEKLLRSPRLLFVENPGASRQTKRIASRASRQTTLV